LSLTSTMALATVPPPFTILASPYVNTGNVLTSAKTGSTAHYIIHFYLI